jgi:hypothetical protein
MSSTTRSPFSEVETQSRDLSPRVIAVLDALIRTPARRARFFNMLSFMQHIKSRPIVARQSNTGVNHQTLKELAEETRYALFFNRTAERVAGRAATAAASARAYRGRLDATIAGEIDGYADALTCR